jgi:eukaryotic-like serine/threonine-protein kinase
MSSEPLDRARANEIELALDTHVGRYVIRERLAGRDGIVYAAIDPELDRKVALEILRIEGAEPSAARERLIAEVGAMAQLANPNIVVLHDVGRLDDRVFVVTELVEGHTLAEWLTATRPGWREILAIFAAAARGLDAAHAAGLVHGDFSGSKLLIGSDGRVRVTGFGHWAARAPSTHPDAGSDRRDFCAALAGTLRARGRRVPARLERMLARAQKADAGAQWPSLAALTTALAPRQERRRLALLVVAAVAVAVSGLWLGYRQQRSRLLCTGADRKLAVVWNPARRGTVERAFLASGKPYAAAAFAEVARVLDQYASRWVAMHTDACVDTRLRHRQSEDVLELRMICLDGRLGELRALVDHFASADWDAVEHAVRTAHALGDVAGCADAQALSNPLRPPADPQVRAAVAEVRDRLATVKALYDAGRFREGRDRALPLARRAAALNYRPVEAEVELTLGRLQSGAGDGKAAEQALQQAVWAAQAGHHDEVAARGWIELITLYQGTQARFAEALELAPRVTATLERLGGNEELEGLLHLALGRIHLETSRYDEADREARRALALFEHRFGADSLRVADALDEVGDVAFHRGGYTAEPWFARELAIKQKHYGDDHPETARAIGRIASVRYFQSRFAEARDLGERALAIDERALGPEHRLVARDLNNLSMPYKRLGQFDKAAAVLERAVKIDRKVQPDHPMYATHLLNLSRLLTQLGRPAEALPDARDAARLIERRVGAVNDDVAGALAIESEALHALGRDAEAREAITRSIAIFDQVFGRDYLHNYEQLLTLAEIELALAQPARALAAIERARAVTRTAHIDPADRAQMDFLTARAFVAEHTNLAQARTLALSARAVLVENGSLKKPLAEVDRFLERQGWSVGR